MMKLKPVTLYLSAFALVVILIFFFASSDNSDANKSSNPHEGLSMDNPHANLPGAQGEAPSKENVSEKYKQKVAELRSNIEKDPDDTLSMKELAHFQYMAHMTDESMELYNKILTYDPHRTDILFAIGVINYNNKKYDEAERIVKSVLEYDPANTVAYYNLGAISQARGDKKAALEHWNKLIKDFPNTHEAFLAETAIKKMEVGE